MHTTDTRPAVEFDPGDYANVSDAYRHEDGSVTVIVWDETGVAESPREYDGNVATMIQQNSHCIDIDSDDAGLGEARDRFSYYHHKYDRETLMRRYVAMFRDDIAAYVEYWSAGDSYGWGYVTREAWEESGITETTPGDVFDAEVRLYGQWAEGEVYAARHLTVGAPIVRYGAHGAYVDGHETDEDVCAGFLGYDDRRDIAASFTDSPIVEVLA